MTEVIIIMLSLGIPASINFRFVTDSVAVNPIYNTKTKCFNAKSFFTDTFRNLGKYIFGGTVEISHYKNTFIFQSHDKYTLFVYINIIGNNTIICR